MLQIISKFSWTFLRGEHMQGLCLLEAYVGNCDMFNAEYRDSLQSLQRISTWSKIGGHLKGISARCLPRTCYYICSLSHSLFLFISYNGAILFF